MAWFRPARRATGVTVERGAKLQVGCGRSPIPGWINTDAQALDGVDLVLDVRDGIPFRELGVIYGEHFLEHLTIDETLAFFADSRDALGVGGCLRLSTPNLEWVWATHDPRVGDEGSRARRALIANRAFYGWEHRFLWTRALLEEALLASGFVDVRFCRYGESSRPELAGLERHPTDIDSAELPHVLVVEATRGEPQPERLLRLRALVREELLDHLRG